MQALNRSTANAPAPYPEVFLQFGGGNFVRAFTDWIIDVFNEKQGTRYGVLVATTTDRKSYREWNEQEGLYHLYTKGIRDGETVNEQRLITAVSRVISMEPDWEDFLKTAENPATKYVVSNTTEAGIRFSADDRAEDNPPAEFPAKLTLWLHRRWQHFSGADDAGLTFLPVELIEDNGIRLRDTLLQYADHFGLEPEFASWIKTANRYCNTLVDRIVPGISREELPNVQEELGYADSAATSGEPYHIWAIEAPAAVREALPLDKIGLNVLFTDDLGPYRESKVRILNGAHTSMVPTGLLAGMETVGDVMRDERMSAFVRQAVFEEIIPTLDLPDIDLNAYAESILDRFRNPFIHHRLLSISLNSTAKFRTRVLPSILAYEEKFDRLPPALCLSLACLIRMYHADLSGEPFALKDSEAALERMRTAWADNDGCGEAYARTAGYILGWKANWGRDLNDVPGLLAKVIDDLVTLEGGVVPLN